ncbi:hypothetical protein WN73_33870 [Bradyrhizobium sp. CCBAU 45394]|nr:hypothetical protein [Bradyrhizobium sp. CCBAU 45394]
MPNNEPFLERKPRSFNQIAIFLVPSGPEFPSPFRARSKARTTISASTGSIASFFFCLFPMISASTDLYPNGMMPPLENPRRAFSFMVRVVARDVSADWNSLTIPMNFLNRSPLASLVSGSANEISSTLCLRSARTVSSCSNWFLNARENE